MVFMIQFIVTQTNFLKLNISIKNNKMAAGLDTFSDRSFFNDFYVGNHHVNYLRRFYTT